MYTTNDQQSILIIIPRAIQTRRKKERANQFSGETRNNRRVGSFCMTYKSQVLELLMLAST